MLTVGTPETALAVRNVVSRAACLSGVSSMIRNALGRFRGGFILAYHNCPTEQQIDALYPDEPVDLDVLVCRQRAGKSTAGLFAITMDDGVGDVVRATVELARRRHWPVTFYLPTGYLDTGVPMLFQWWLSIHRFLPTEKIRLRSSTLDLSRPGARDAFLRQFQNILYTRPEREFAGMLHELTEYLVANRYVCADAIRPPAPISWEEVSRLAGGGLFRFGSHAVSHTALSALDADGVEREFAASRQRIQECAGSPCRHVCYPYGGAESIGTAAPAIAARYYESAVTMSRGRIAGRSPFLLPRIPLYPRDSGPLAGLKVMTL